MLGTLLRLYTLIHQKYTFLGFCDFFFIGALQELTSYVYVLKLLQHANICSGEYSGMSSIDSNHEAHKEKKESIIQDDFWAVETSSCDSTADEPIEISSSSSTRTRLENRCNPRPDNFILQKTVAGRPQTQKKVSNNAVSHVEVRKSSRCWEN